MNLIFQNSHFVAIDKPVLALTTPSRMGLTDQRPCIGTQLQTQLQQQIFPVHRLDFEVSGLTLFALNAQAHRMANGWFEKRQVTKTYSALTTGPVPGPEGSSFVWKNKLVRGKKRSFVAPHGDWAETEAKFVKKIGLGHNLWELHPYTGRSHQLRVHLSLVDNPIVGDRLYGSSEKFQPGGIALRSLKLDFSKCPEREDLGLPDSLEINPSF